jgi:hypothetical protein
MPLYPVPMVGRAMKECVDREFSGASRGRGCPAAVEVAGGCGYARCDQEATGGPEASVRAQA